VPLVGRFGELQNVKLDHQRFTKEQDQSGEVVKVVIGIDPIAFELAQNYRRHDVGEASFCNSRRLLFS
jgi:hypothetical protein